MSKRRSKRSRANSDDLFDVLQPLLLLAAFLWFGKNPIYKNIIGSIVGLCLVYWLVKRIRYQKRMRPLQISGVDEMSGVEFEHFVADLLRSQGYQVENIGGMEDFGIDLIASRNQIRHAVQVKRWNWPVGVSAIRAAVAGKNYHHCDRAVVITNNYFTWRAKNLAKANNCKLIDRDGLSKQIQVKQLGGN